jgi:hypothetical protein
MRKAICREKLIKLVKKSKPGKYEPTIADVLYWYDNFNAHIFNGELPKLHTIALRSRPGFWGMSVCDIDRRNNKVHNNLLLNNKFESFKEFLEVIGHESIHLWEFKESGNMTHGIKFWKWAPKFKSLGLTISEKM